MTRRRRHPSKHGVLGWLIPASQAMALSNLDDETLTQLALDSLPSDLIGPAKKQFVEAKVQRWIGTISGLPGGNPAPELRERHQPDAKVLPKPLSGRRLPVRFNRQRRL